MELQPTNRPWVYDRDTRQVRATSPLGYGSMVANLVTTLPWQCAPETTALPADEIDANGEFIERACNAHDDMLEACHEALELIKLCIRSYAEVEFTYEEATETIRAAIAKAEG